MDTKLIQPTTIEQGVVIFDFSEWPQPQQTLLGGPASQIFKSGWMKLATYGGLTVAGLITLKEAGFKTDIDFSVKKLIEGDIQLTTTFKPDYVNLSNPPFLELGIKRAEEIHAAIGLQKDVSFSVDASMGVDEEEKIVLYTKMLVSEAGVETPWTSFAFKTPINPLDYLI